MANQQWMSRPADERFETLDALAASVNARRKLSTAVDIDVRKLHVESQTISIPQPDGSSIPSDRLVFNSEIIPARPTHWAFGQMCRETKLASDTMRRLPTSIVADALNYRLQKVEKPELKLMAIQDPEGEVNTLQAITSRTYGRIWDADVVQATQNLVNIADEKHGKKFFNPKDWSGKPSGLYASDHDIFLFMVDGGSVVDVGWDQKGQRDLMHRGFIIWNSEVGSASFGIMMFMFRVVCGNHIIWDASELQKLLIRHTTGGPTRFVSEALPHLEAYCNQIAKPQEDAIKRVRGFLLPDKDDDIIGLGKKYGFTRGETISAIAAAKREEGQCATGWDLINGYTAHARTFEHTDTRLDLETRAGKLINVFSATAITA